MNNITYKEGCIFAVPLKNKMFSVGIISRISKSGVLLGYFFNFTTLTVPELDKLPPLLPSDAIKVVKFGDLGIISGEWPVIGSLQNWKRTDWPMPKFIRRDPIRKTAKLISYSNDDPNCEIAADRCDFGTNEYEDDSLLGSGFVEQLMTRITHGSLPA